MRFGVNVPNFGRYGNPEYFAELASLVEKSGWDGLFVWDHMLVWDGNEVHDPWLLMVLAAIRTERILLGPMVTPLPRRRPWQVARQAATLDHISGGRVILGVGIGAPEEVEFGWFGEPTDSRIRADMLDESLEIIEWSVDGRALHFRRRALQPPRDDLPPETGASEDSDMDCGRVAVKAAFHPCSTFRRCVPHRCA